VRRFDDGVRRVESVAEVTGMESGTPLLQDIFRFPQTGRNNRKIVGTHQPTGIVPKLMHDLREKGIEVDLSIFQRGSSAEQ
jgi:pilus assembly protein CpaF